MKKLILLIVSLAFTYYLSGQSHGITYQAVIIDADAREIPGIDITGNILPDQPLTVRFTILGENGTVDYQEVQSTTTDRFGMINLTIGLGTVTTLSPGIFTAIDWNGTSKILRVEISLGDSGSDYKELSYQSLYFVPYAFHRNITATGTMIIDGASTLNSSLEVANGSPSNLTGNLTVTGTSSLNNQVTINAELNGTDDQYDAYPLRVQGSNQGIAITIDGSRTSSNNFVTFRDANGIQGRIEGQVDADVYTDPQFIYDQAMFAAKTAVQIANVAIAAAATIIDPGNVGIEAANSALLAAEIIEYEIFAFSNLGVSYQSGSGDYAEWLPRLDPAETIGYGQIVGVYGGKVTKRTEGADLLLVVSKSPIVLGNMPSGKLPESLCEKIAFMGQVPVWVKGKVNKGDYIISMESGSGLGTAVSPSDITVDQMGSIVGRAWTVSANAGTNLVNTVVGLKTNEWIGFIRSGTEEIDSLKKEIASLKARNRKSEKILAQLVPGYLEAMGPATTEAETPTADKTKSPVTIVGKSETIKKSPENMTLTREILLENFSKAAAFLKTQGADLSKNAFYSKLNSDPEYKELVINTVLKLSNKK
jgi:hypothetical protein